MWMYCLFKRSYLGGGGQVWAAGTSRLTHTVLSPHEHLKKTNPEAKCVGGSKLERGIWLTSAVCGSAEREREPSRQLNRQWRRRHVCVSFPRLRPSFSLPSAACCLLLTPRATRRKQARTEKPRRPSTGPVRYRRHVSHRADGLRGSHTFKLPSVKPGAPVRYRLLWAHVGVNFFKQSPSSSGRWVGSPRAHVRSCCVKLNVELHLWGVSLGSAAELASCMSPC